MWRAWHATFLGAGVYHVLIVILGAPLMRYVVFDFSSRRELDYSTVTFYIRSFWRFSSPSYLFMYPHAALPTLLSSDLNRNYHQKTQRFVPSGLASSSISSASRLASPPSPRPLNDIPADLLSSGRKPVRNALFSILPYSPCLAHGAALIRSRSIGTVRGKLGR